MLPSLKYRAELDVLSIAYEAKSGAPSLWLAGRQCNSLPYVAYTIFLVYDEDGSLFLETEEFVNLLGQTSPTMCCPTCGCLGFCAKPPWYDAKLCRGGLVVLASRTYDGLKNSAQAGCEFCGLASQAYGLLASAQANPSVNIHVRQHSIADLLVIDNDAGDEDDCIEIFASAGTWTFLAEFDDSLLS
jgi:hypothetical protein